MLNFKIIQNRSETEAIGHFIQKHRFLFSLLVFGLQLGLNLYKIDDIGLWHDEAFTVNTAIKSIPGIVEVSQSDVNPPLYPVVVHYWIKCFGISEYSLRLLSAIAVALAAAFLFRFCLRFLNWQTAVFSALMFFTNYVFFYYAQEARTYSLVLLFVVLSNYLFFLMMEEQQVKKSLGFAVLLGLVNICLFYFHFLSCFALIGQVILFPVFAFEKARTAAESKVRIKARFVKSYCLSWIVFFILLLPFYERFLFLVRRGGDKMWLQKPVHDDLKRCIYEMFTDKEIYQLYIYSAAVIALLLVFRRLRDIDFKLKILLFALISGPFILYLNYLVASYSPIFLLRYVLFTFLGFILAFCYLLSALKIKFGYKLIFFVILAGYSFTKAKIPKEINQDYKNAMVYLKSVKTGSTLISTDLPEVFAYYYDKDIFGITNDKKRAKVLGTQGIFVQNYSLNWPDSLDFTHIKDIYYTQSFEWYNDGSKIVFTKLNNRFSFVEKVEKFKGVYIDHFTNKNYKSW